MANFNKMLEDNKELIIKKTQELIQIPSVLDETKRRLDQANSELDKLVGVRTRQIQRKLNSVTSLADTTGYFLDEGTDDSEE